MITLTRKNVVVAVAIILAATWLIGGEDDPVAWPGAPGSVPSGPGIGPGAADAVALQVLMGAALQGGAWGGSPADAWTGTGGDVYGNALLGTGSNFDSQGNGYVNLGNGQFVTTGF